MSWVVPVTGAFFKGCSKFLCRLHTTNLDTLLASLPTAGPHGTPTGLLTYSNHISTLDEPLWNVALPFSLYNDQQRFRWVLGAKDIMFTNKFFSWYFRSGRILCTDRHGPGIYQWSIDQAIAILRAGGWVHLFPEGYVNQPRDYKNQEYQLLRFKWGISRILMEAPNSVKILPVYLKGFDQIMPEGRSFPWNFIPRTRQHIGVHFGEQPLDRRRLIDHLMQGHEAWDRGRPIAQSQGPFYQGEASELRNCRIRIADTLRQIMIQLQHRVDDADRVQASRKQ